MSLLAHHVEFHDAVILCVRSVNGQCVEGLVERVYSRRYEGPVPYDVGRLRLVGAGIGLDQVPLRAGERALVFLAWVPTAQSHYQMHSYGHFSLRDIDGQACAVANWHLLDWDPWGPEHLRRAAFLPEAGRADRVALPFALLEAHLQEAIAQSEPSALRPADIAR